MFKKIASTALLVGALAVGNSAFAEEEVDHQEVVEVVEGETTEEEMGNLDQEDASEGETVDLDLDQDEASEEEATEDGVSEKDEQSGQGTESEIDEEEKLMITPISSIYEAILLMEEAIVDLTEGASEKALLQLELADKRLAEAKVMIEIGNNEEVAEQLIEESEKNADEAEKNIEEAEEAGEDVTDLKEVVTEKVENRFRNLLALLEREDLPETAKAGIQKAIENKTRAMERAGKIQLDVVETEESTEEVAVEVEVTTEEETTPVEVQATEVNNKKIEKANEKVEKAIQKAEDRVQKANQKAEKKIEKELEKRGNGRP